VRRLKPEIIFITVNPDMSTTPAMLVRESRNWTSARHWPQRVLWEVDRPLESARRAKTSISAGRPIPCVILAKGAAYLMLFKGVSFPIDSFLPGLPQTIQFTVLNFSLDK
jgi:hypothetical protein